MKQRVITQVQLDNDLLVEQKKIMGAEQLSEVLHRQLGEKFVNDMLSSRLKDIVTEEVIGPDGSSSINMKLELFVFNKEELKGLIEMVKNGINII